MKLVDVDKLPIKYEGHVVGVWKNDLDNAPTVEAIPIEWIGKYSRGELSYSDYWAIIRLVGDWKKENEIDRCR